MQNDAALDWLERQVNRHLVEAIEQMLKTQLDGSDYEPEAEAAAALLVDCTSSATKMKYRTINLCYWAKVKGLWDLAIEVVDKILQSDWAKGWVDPQKKFDALKELRSELEQAQEENQNIKA